MPTTISHHQGREATNTYYLVGKQVPTLTLNMNSDSYLTHEHYDH